MLRLRAYVFTSLALALLVLLAGLPFLQTHLPRSDDGHLHLYRIIALDDAWTRDGRLYPRYASNLVYGYGAPLFNYFPPLAYTPGVLLHRLGLTYGQAFQATMLGALFAAAAGMLLLGAATWPGADRYKPAAGFGAAALYIYSPYLLFDAVGRGTLTEVVALAVLPWVLWALVSLARTVNAQAESGPGRFYALWRLVGLMALFIPLHNVVTLHGGLLLAAVGLALLWQSARRGRLLVMFVLAGLVAILMSLFFLAPALLEGDQVKIRAVTEALSFIDVTRTLRPLHDLFVLFHTADPSNLQPHTPIVYSWVALLLALAGTVWAWRGQATVRPLVIALLGIVAFCTLLMVETPLSVWLWRTLPLLDYTQFAWRVLGIGSLALAWLGGWGIASLIEKIDLVGKTRLAPAVFVWMLLLIGIMLYGLPWTIARHEPLASSSILDAQAHERDSGELALSSYSEYLPTWVETPPDPLRLQAAFASGQPVPRLRETEDVTVQAARWGGLEGIITFEAAQPATLIFDWLYVPGWRARFTNAAAQSLPLTVKPIAPYGFVSVQVPAGVYKLEIAWHETPLQRGAGLLSAILWSGWGIIGIGLVFVTARRAAPASQSLWDASSRAWPAVSLQTIFVCAGLVAFKIIVIDQTQNIWRHERYINDERGPLAVFADEILLREAQVGAASVRAGESLPLTLYWQTRQILSRDDSSLIELRNAQGLVAVSGGSFQPGGLAMTHWQPDTYVIENTLLDVPADVPPGNYTVTVGLYDPITKDVRSVLNAEGNPQDVAFTLGAITVERPAAPASVDEIRPLTQGIAFVGVTTPLPADAAPGQAFVFDPIWELQAAADPSTQVRLLWASCPTDAIACPSSIDDFKAEISSPPMPLVATYPLYQWQQGDVWRGIHALFVPGDLDTGTYAVWLDAIPARERISLGTMQISAPERTFVLPQDLSGDKISWTNGLVLQGYTGASEDFTLYWQTEQPIPANLRLSVQIIDAAERIIAQQDGVPVNWTRPVAGWAVGEVIATPYAFDVPEGAYRVRLVWYEAITGVRVPLTESGDAAVLEIEP